MHNLIAACICLAIALLMLILRKAYFNLPIYELKRQAKRGDHFAKAIYPAIAYPAFRGFLWLLMVVASSMGLILLSRELPLWLAVIPAVIWMWLIFSWIPNRRIAKISYKTAQLMSPFFAWFISSTYPALKQLERLQRRYPPLHTKIYESEDLRMFLQRQARQEDNRISPAQLSRLFKLIDFESAKVKDFYRPWKQTLKLVPEDIIGPKLLDEMHKSKQNAFVVVKNKNSRQVIGVLNQATVGLHSEGKVRDHMENSIEVINEFNSIERAFNQFASGVSPVLVVTDQENEALGIITLKDALKAWLELEDHVREPASQEQQEAALPEVEVV
jgi:CBS domain containing-hemolysin-like protein